MSASQTGTPRTLELSQVQNGAVVEFKRPQVQRKSKPKILTEERYIEEMSKIIQRDFFPDLEKLRAQNDYLDAEARRDFLQMSEIRARYSLGKLAGCSSRRQNNRNNAMSPATFETPISTAGANATPRTGAAPSDTPTPHSTSSRKSSTSTAEGGPDGCFGKQLSLDAFLQNYTSEDNQSFQEIIETADEKLRQKYAVLYNHEQLSAQQLQRALLLPSIEQQFDSPDPQRRIETWTYTNKNSIMYIPDGVEMTDEERVQAADRRQSIQHCATRLPETPNNPTSTKAVIPGAELTPNASNTPRIRGFELLRSPSPRPGEAFSPIMTWGEIDGTPFRLDGGDTPLRPTSGPSFRISENSRRENIAIALAEKVSEKMRTQKQQALNTARRNIGSPFVRSGRDRLASMSPAAQRLATGKLGLRSTPLMLTPSPRPRNNVLKRKSTTPSLVRATPKMVKSGGSVSDQRTPANSKSSESSDKCPIDTGSTITDDLLKIPTKRRSAAADFF
ncbi:splicing factor ESS-2 homolog [Scaptodrosophila lebanonensis]|uniref:Splicing factor ESS-2 homolog n=1 Tax=Drosophila lebanonensis TaxID=7225 RepID=A0A6J2U0G8_DROLE|nr:splicing factor ESS-2 homolog [Scaptodrosophila lebanonensis]